MDILNAVATGRSFAGDLLDKSLDELDLSQTADGRLMTHLVCGVLRMQGHLDWILAGLYRGNYAKMEENLKNILRTGLYQLKFSERIPPFAVVDEAVKLAKRTAPFAEGLTNAVLRSYLRNADKISFPALDKSPAQHIAALYSHPLWLVKRWLQGLGNDETIALCRTDNDLPPVTLRTNTLKISREDLIHKLSLEDFQCEPTRFSPDGIRLTHSPLPIAKTFFFKDGLLRLQDEAAQLVSLLANPQIGETVLDACAGSGGKTLHQAALIKNSGQIVALDHNPDKLAQLQKDASRMDVTAVETQAFDLESPLPPAYSEKFDCVLVDAPCSGTGTLSRNPEIKWRLKESDIPGHSQKQKSILNHASSAVKSGGRLIYSTCSLLYEENDEVISFFLKEHPDFFMDPIAVHINDELKDPRGFLRTYPHRHGMDGFFGAVLKRRI